MTSAAKPEADQTVSGQLRRALHPGGWSLRGRLLGQLVALVAVACVVMGVVTEVGLRTFLLDKLNGQLAGSIQRVDSPIGGGPRAAAARAADFGTASVFGWWGGNRDRRDRQRDCDGRVHDQPAELWKTGQAAA
ncbi:hypothetical protein [Fodinicola feengrottensis]|nr:hypothetical protein [Fodinicola feengrottensis]